MLSFSLALLVQAATAQQNFDATRFVGTWRFEGSPGMQIEIRPNATASVYSGSEVTQEVWKTHPEAKALVLSEQDGEAPAIVCMADTAAYVYFTDTDMLKKHLGELASKPCGQDLSEDMTAMRFTRK